MIKLRAKGRNRNTNVIVLGFCLLIEDENNFKRSNSNTEMMEEWDNWSNDYHRTG
jgi:hypothetical protein